MRDFDRTGQWNDYNYVNEARNAGYGQPTLNALSEAIGWLRARGLVTPDLSQDNSNAAFVTRFGRKLLDEGPGHLRATAGLQDGVHPVIEREACPQFMLEKYELGVFAAMRAVEIRVRTLGRFGKDDYGVDLMNRAFGPGAPLRDPEASKGEQDGMRALFAAAYAVLRNPAVIERSTTMTRGRRPRRSTRRACSCEFSIASRRRSCERLSRVGIVAFGPRAAGATCSLSALGSHLCARLSMSRAEGGRRASGVA